jgi:hypothetical protein
LPTKARRPKHKPFILEASLHFLELPRHPASPGECVFLAGESRYISKNRGRIHMVLWGTRPNGKGGRRVYAHHAAWMARHQSDIPKGWVVHHTCGNWACVNPHHLECMPESEHAKADKKMRHQQGRIR